MLKKIHFFKQSPQNISVLLLRYLNIWSLVGIPLLFMNNKGVLEILPLIGFGGLAFLVGGLITPKARTFLITYYYLSGITLILFFSLLVLFNSNFYYMACGAFLLGFTTVNYEVKCMYSAISKEDAEKMIDSLKTYNMLKVIGIALGFFFAALLSGNRIAYNSSFLFTGLAILFLLVSIIKSMKNETKNREDKVNDIGINTISWRKIFCSVLFILDVMLFTFWYVYLPKKMVEKGFSGMEIATFLSLQGAFHALCQSVWSILIVKFGAFKSYCASYILHLIIIIILGNMIFDFMIGCILFSLMGILNSGTFLASSMLFYSNKNKSLSDNYIHLGSSYLGKTLGTIVCQI